MAISYSPLKINGVLSTDKTVLQNLNDLCSAAGAFLTFDISQGKWAVVINKTGTSVKSYNDSNIIGSINIQETGVNELYNSASIEFPHKTLRDQTDFVEVTIPSEDRYPNEVDNTLQIQSVLINDPVQAQYLAGVELKQSRLNKIINFTTDYTSLGLKAGDLIDVTSTMYGYSGKIFRVTKVEEIDEDVIGVSITALEYSPDVYSSSGLVFAEKTKKTGILLKEQNTTLRTKDDIDTGNQLARLLAANVGAGLLKKLFSRISGTETFGPENTSAEDIDKLLSNAKRPALTSISMPTYICEGQTITITVGHSCTSCFFDNPEYDYDWEITGVFEEDITSITVNGEELAEVSLTGTIPITTSGTIVITTADTAGSSSSQTLSMTIGGISNSTIIYDVLDIGYSVTASTNTITEGDSVVITVNTSAVNDGTVVPYVIAGSATGKVSSPALNGNITISSNSANLTITTSDDAVFTGTQNLTFILSPTLPSNPCKGSVDLFETISVLDNDTAPPADTTRQYVSTPVVWGGTYDGTTGELKNVFVQRSAFMPIPFPGEPTVEVPVTLSVTQGNPSSITVTSTRTISTVSTLGGTLLEPIVSFNTVAPTSAITGTRTSVWGYY